VVPDFPRAPGSLRVMCDLTTPSTSAASA
jgi:hypothetical protein